MRWIGCVRCEKFQCDFVARTFTPVLPIFDQVLRANQQSQLHKYSMKQTKIWVLGPMGWIGYVRCEKFWCDFVARTFALIAPIQPILYQTLCSNETIQNAPKHYEMQQYLSLGSNGVGRVHSLRKIPKRLHGTNLCINCTCSTRLAPSFV